MFLILFIAFAAMLAVLCQSAAPQPSAAAPRRVRGATLTERGIYSRDERLRRHDVRYAEAMSATLLAAAATDEAEADRRLMAAEADYLAASVDLDADPTAEVGSPTYAAYVAAYERLVDARRDYDDAADLHAIEIHRHLALNALR